MQSTCAERPPAGWGRVLGAALLASVLVTPVAGVQAQSVALGSLAAAIREAGYACSHVIDAKRSEEGAAEGFTVWEVRCNSGRFQVTFKGDTGSKVVPLQ